LPLLVLPNFHPAAISLPQGLGKLGLMKWQFNSMPTHATGYSGRRTINRPGSGTPNWIQWPWDLRDWVAAEPLAGWVQAEIDCLHLEHPQLKANLRTHPDYRPEALLALLSYSYLIGVYAAEDIIEQCYTDGTLRQLCGGDPPPATVLRAFRRANRGLIRWCLEQVLKRILLQRFGLHQGQLPAEWRRCVEAAAASRLELARYLDRFEYVF
jgi:hypothetical protein